MKVFRQFRRLIGDGCIISGLTNLDAAERTGPANLDPPWGSRK